MLLLVAATLAMTEPPIPLPPVVVEDRPIADEAAPSTVIDRSQVQDAVADLPEVLDEQPGLRTSRLGGLGSFSTLSIRGSTADQVLVYLDGIPLNSAEGGPVDLSAIPLGPIDRVVVYRGVSPVTFGGSAIGGVVAIHSRRLAAPRLELEAGGGSFGTRMARAFFGSGGETWGGGVSVDYLGSQGDFSYVDDRGTLHSDADDVHVTRQNNAFDQVSAMAKGHVSLGAHARLHALDLFTWRRRGLPGLGVHPTEEARLTGLRNLSALRLEVDRLGALRAFVGVTAYLTWSRSALHDPLSEVGLAADGTRDESLVPGVDATFRVPIALTDEAEWMLIPTLASTWRYERFQPAVGSTSGQASDRHVLSNAAELSLLMDPADLEIVGSLRHEAAWIRSGGDFGDPLSELTWRAALVWSGLPYTRLKTNVSHSVRFPSLFERFGNTGAVAGNPDLRPERALNVDLGVVHSARWLPAGWAWNVEVFGFVTLAEDLIQFVQNAQNVAVAENVDSATLAGVEAGTFADLLRHLRLRASLTWMHTENTSSIRARRGKALPHRPRWKAYGRVEGYHRFESGFVSGLGASFEAEYLAGNTLDFANLVAAPERVLLGAGAWISVWREQLRLDVNLRNLTGDRVQDLAGFPLPGLTAMATLRYTPELTEPEVP